MSARRGFSLIEVIVAGTLLGVVAATHALVSARYTVRARSLGVGVDRAAAISTAVDLYATMPYASIAADTGCVTITTMANYPHQRCVSITKPTQAITRVQIIIAPEASGFRADTIRVDRSLPPSGSLFS
ncbi:MAG: type II secretion system protein [Gemmatimonadaceae bacterium]